MILIRRIGFIYSSVFAVQQQDIMDTVRTVIDTEVVMIFSKSYCPYCKRTKKLFNDLDVKATVIELDKHPNGVEMQNALERITGQRTVPNVFVRGKHIGGSDDTHRAYESGELGRLLAPNDL